MKGALDIHHALLDREIPHDILRLPRVVLDAEDIPELLGIDADQAVSVRLFVADGQMIAVAMPSGRTPQTQAILKAAGARALRPATAQEVNESTDYAARLVAPMLLPPDMPLYIDARVGRNDTVVTATGDTGTALSIATADLLVATRAKVADLSGVSLADIVLDLEV